jgi:hypothetical protein
MQQNNPASDHNAGDGATKIRDLTTRMLREVAWDRRHGRKPDGNQIEELREVCNAAREQGLHAEDLLIIIKQSWTQLTEAQLLERLDADETLSHVITRAIVELYRADGQ